MNVLFSLSRDNVSLPPLSFSLIFLFRKFTLFTILFASCKYLGLNMLVKIYVNSNLKKIRILHPRNKNDAFLFTRFQHKIIIFPATIPYKSLFAKLIISICLGPCCLVFLSRTSAERDCARFIARK